MEKRYVNIKEVSEYTSLPVKTLYDWASQRKIPSIKLRGRVLFDLQDIDQIMAAHKRDAQQCDKTVNKIVGDILENNYNA
ncbi:MAG: DNA-binding protein [Candidatus Brocadia sp. AMX2]|uniref:Excisionase n=1 Tax=Candidatus Brocadia sinica JPN1 TaxID=1197129 RepID=A0ABQ0K1R8_9BACT|nr:MULTISPECIES: helix-turn-helix domain-containing protein [Brocadia]MBC6932534.1 DNA-binding protein [Candidatus Brocadia sp.]MBL1168067.1 DNA-binding protein [Candidatus Brocadia sp. AMX1]MCK6469405.1 helix-turn-helix domain-containing protein [Candidatus Brocadia sinica]NOG42648.1 helix-turn-helix domain-containing protein [Planctomycetota bacterium]KAA0244001.1 MAG: DNA-binding protein [Candidatus Brocadia sp. AMX2]